MFIIANLLLTIGKILNFILTIYMYIVIFRALISWVNPDPYNPLVQFLNKSTEPILEPIRRKLKMQLWAIDLSPAILILIIWFILDFGVGSLIDFALRIK